ncbi:MAG TPA: hypothetical protein VMW24_24905 [Sedimentisphaerales bacterium]|nr:hypothetical protein [Sedimentisphaerales bacterium]
MLSKKQAKALVRNQETECLRSLSRYPYSFEQLRLEFQGQDFVGFGFAKYNLNDAKCPKLPWDREKGLRIARGRAEKDIAEQLMRVPVNETKSIIMRMRVIDGFAEFTERALVGGDG